MAASSHPARSRPSGPNVTAQLTAPRRLLIVSGTQGEGHNAAGRALQEAAGALWPEVAVEWLDTLDVMGPGVGPLFRGIYAGNVEGTPWLYQLFYESLFRPWFAHATKRFVGAWAGRRLAGRLRTLRPDLILSTYPLGSAALEWLRRHRSLPVPVAAWVCDFAPSPLWVYAGLDLNVVADEVAEPVARAQVPGAQVVVGGLPVADAFRPRPKEPARAALGLPAESFVALVSCGSLGFGDVARTAHAVTGAGPEVITVVATGHNDSLRERLAAEGDRAGRLRVLGWTDDVPALLAASDVVITNAGGSTAMEALACGVPVIMHRPIAGHGRANAKLMAAAGLAEVTEDEEHLALTIRRLQQHPELLARRRQRAVAAAQKHRLGDVLERLTRQTLNEVA